MLKDNTRSNILAKSELKEIVFPSTKEIENAYKSEYYKVNFFNIVRSTIFILTVASAVAVLVAVLLLPVLRIYGKSMEGTLDDGNLVISVKSSNFKSGDVVAFYYNNNILVKRVIAQSGQWVDMDKSGNIYVNQVMIDEPYLKEKSYGQTNVEFPFQVPEGRIFVVGDNRANSIDSRNKTIGTISEEQVVGKLVFKIWPLSEIGTVK